jgi:hypothetical protein
MIHNFSFDALNDQARETLISELFQLRVFDLSKLKLEPQISRAGVNQLVLVVDHPRVSLQVPAHPNCCLLTNAKTRKRT